MFTEEDAKLVHHPHSDALVVKIKIEPNNIYRIHIDNGNSINVLTYDVYKKMGFLDEDMSSISGHLYGFTGASISIKSLIRLPVTFGNEPCTTT